MGKAQRDKGARGERNVAEEIKRLTGKEVKRDLSQTRDGGADLLGLAPYRIEVKSYKSFAVTGHLEQCAKGKADDEICFVVLNPDRKRMMVLMFLDDFCPLLATEMIKSSQ